MRYKMQIKKWKIKKFKFSSWSSFLITFYLLALVATVWWSFNVFRSESVDEGEKRKSYNYRVVMCVEGMEFDMPGRCSAGQKV